MMEPEDRIESRNVKIGHVAEVVTANHTVDTIVDGLDAVKASSRRHILDPGFIAEVGVFAVLGQKVVYTVTGGDTVAIELSGGKLVLGRG